MKKINLYQRMQEEDGYVRGMYLPDEKGTYLIKHKHDEFYIACFDGERWDENVERIICWREIPECLTDCPF